MSPHHTLIDNQEEKDRQVQEENNQKSALSTRDPAFAIKALEGSSAMECNMAGKFVTGGPQPHQPVGRTHSLLHRRHLYLSEAKQSLGLTGLSLVARTYA